MTLLRTSLFLALVLVVALPAQALVINEIRIDGPSTDTDEFFELAGVPGESLDGLYYIVIGDGAGGSGVVENITDLTGQVIQPDGFFAWHDTDGAAAACTGYDVVDGGLSFENSDNVTHLLVQGFTAALQDDLDTDDDGTLDVIPWTTIVDCVALIETVGSGDLVYCSNTVGPDGTFVPGLAVLCEGTWLIGSFDLCVNDTAGAANTDQCVVSNDVRSWGALKGHFGE